MSNAELDSLGGIAVGLVVTVVICAVCAYYAARIAREKNRGVGEAVALGALLGLIGVLIVAVLPSRTPDKKQRTVD